MKHKNVSIDATFVHSHTEEKEKLSFLPPATKLGRASLLRGGGACVVAPEGACVVAPGGCVVALGGMHCCSGGRGMHGCSGVCVVAPSRACTVAQGVCVVALGGHVWLLPGGHAWDMARYGDTINERAVRILLECILVSSEIGLKIKCVVKANFMT